jgi:cysteinyl-tRNA synthetase
MNYTVDVLDSAVKSVERLRNVSTLLDNTMGNDGELSETAKTVVLRRRSQFSGAMDDDFNTADAIAAWFEFARDINTAVKDTEEISKADLDEYRKLFDEFNSVLGLLYVKDEPIPSEVLELVEKRMAAKKAKDFTLADSIREDVRALGYTIEETRQGVNIKKNV